MRNKARDVRLPWTQRSDTQSRTRTVTSTMLGRREKRERMGRAGLTGEARRLGHSYASGK